MIGSGLRTGNGITIGGLGAILGVSGAVAVGGIGLVVGSLVVAALTMRGGRGRGSYVWSATSAELIPADLAEPADARAGSEPGWICLRACFWHRDCRGEPCREPVAHRCCTSHSSPRLAPSGPQGSGLAPAVLAALVPDQSGTCSDRQHRDPGARAEIDTGIGQLTAAVRGIVAIRGIGVLVGSHVLQCLAQQECPSQHALLRVGLLWLGGGKVLRRRVRRRGCWRGRGRACCLGRGSGAVVTRFGLVGLGRGRRPLVLAGVAVAVLGRTIVGVSALVGAGTVVRAPAAVSGRLVVRAALSRILLLVGALGVGRRFGVGRRLR